jgi:hypothetical protein
MEYKTSAIKMKKCYRIPPPPSFFFSYFKLVLQNCVEVYYSATCIDLNGRSAMLQQSLSYTHIHMYNKIFFFFFLIWFLKMLDLI